VLLLTVARSGPAARAVLLAALMFLVACGVPELGHGRRPAVIDEVERLA
jgi:hypothetical protein